MFLFCIHQFFFTIFFSFLINHNLSLTLLLFLLNKHKMFMIIIMNLVTIINSDISLIHLFYFILFPNANQFERSTKIRKKMGLNVLILKN